MSRDQTTDPQRTTEAASSSTQATDAGEWARGEGIGAASATPHWQQRAGGSTDPVQYKLWCSSRLAEMSAPIQRREMGGGQPDGAIADAAPAPSAGPGAALPEGVQSKMEGAFNHDFSSVRVHEGGQAASVGAQAYAQGNDVHFAPGQYDPQSQGGQELLGHELAHVVQQREGRVATTAQYRMDQGPGVAVNDDRGLEREADDWGARAARGESVGRGGGEASVASGAIQRREVGSDAEITGKQDWTTADRTSNAKRWQDACLHNLNAVDTTQFVKIVERRDFYKWFYEYTSARGFHTRWALAAYVVANGAHEIADMGGFTDDTVGLTNVQLQGIMREGNQDIFDNVLPKLKKLLDGGPKVGKDALAWDKQVLAEEQHLIQPLYDKMEPDTKKKLEYIARKKRLAGFGAWVTGGDKVKKGDYNKEGRVPGFNQDDLNDPEDRWKYGMELGQKFAPEDTGYHDGDAMPSVGAGYKDGTELAKVGNKANLHQLDAWLSPERLTRVKGTPGADLSGLLDKLTPYEKSIVVKDHSPDGWQYSKQFAQFGSIDEAMVRKAMPTDAGSAAAVTAFMASYAAEKKAVDRKYPDYTFPMGM